MGKGEPSLHVWLDRFSGHSIRKFYAGFYCEDQNKIALITKQVSRHLWPIRTIKNEDLRGNEEKQLAKRLFVREFQMPILEKYPGRGSFYGIFDFTTGLTLVSRVQFCGRAVAFFQDVARALPNAIPETEDRNVYPIIENRRKVASHLLRERSRLLSVACKERDNHQCRICDLLFDHLYGTLGAKFAEAHHIVPLSLLREGVRTKLDDLITVSANCHRILHRDGRETG